MILRLLFIFTMELSSTKTIRFNYVPLNQTQRVDFCHTNDSNVSNSRRDSYITEDDVLTKWIDLTGTLREQFAFITGNLNPEVSFVGSPLAALRPLGKLIVGAQGKTEKELMKLIGLQKRTDLEAKFRRINNIMKDIPGVQMDMITQVYLSRKRTELITYSEEIKRIFGADVQLINMSDPVFVASNINFWIATQTHDRIQHVLSARDLKADSDLIIINAVHFHSKWKYKFSSVKLSTFYGINGERELMFMSVVTYLQYAESVVLKAKLVQIPFQEEETKLVIILPNDRKGLPLILEQLKLVPVLLNTIVFEDLKVNISIPRFKIGTQLDLGALYEEMGLKNAMQGEGLTQMARGKVLLSKAVQKAVVDLSEEGSLTSGLIPSIVPEFDLFFKPKTFTANHPFLFFILTQKQQLFAGEFYGNDDDGAMNPTQEKKSPEFLDSML